MFRFGFRSFYIAVLWVTAAALLSACGGGGGGGGSGSSTGSIVVQADWDASAATALSLPGTDALHQPVSVITVRAIVSAADISPVIQQDFPATAGAATITGIPAGTMRTLTLQGLDGAGTPIFEAIIPGLTITAGQVTNAGAITLTLIGAPVTGLTVNPTAGLVTTEAGGTATFTIVLNTPPTADVFVDVTSADITEDEVQEGINVATRGGMITLTFTAVNWSIPQTVTVVGKNDPIPFVDGNQAVTITTPATTSADVLYNGLNPADVSVTNTDIDTPGITVNPTSGLVTTEAGGTDTFTVVLNTAPGANVVIPVSSSDTTEARVQGGDSPATPVAAINLTFTIANWFTPQTVTVVGQDDVPSVDDGSQAVTIATAPATGVGSGYVGINAADVSASNSDDDNAGITVNPTSGLITTEAGGTDTFTMVLDTQPTANVTIGVSSSDITEALVQGGSSPGTPVASLTVTFTTGNWNAPQTITVVGQDDPADDGNQAITILTAAAASADANYNGLNAADVTGSNTDNDAAGITVTPVAGLVTTEAGVTDTFTVVLDTQPTANVTMDVTSPDISEVKVQGGSSPGTPVTTITLTFTNLDWSTPQTVTVVGQQDAVPSADGNQAVTVVTAAAASADGNYNTLNAADVAVTNNDIDGVGITVTPTNGLVTTEAGGTDTFTVVLNVAPATNVTVGVSSGDTTEALVQGGNSPATPVAAITLTFTNLDWATPQTVTVVGQDETIVDGNQAITIVTAPAAGDAAYVGFNAPDVSATNNDDDIAGITVNPTFGLVTTEAGGTDTFTVVLNTTPAFNVTIPVSTSDNTEAKVQGGDSPATPVDSITLTFTPGDWSTPQTVTVVGQDEALNDGNQAITILTGAATSTDGFYDNLNADDVSVTNNDDDDAGITVNPTSGLTAGEAGGTTTFTMVLDTEPTGDVVLTVTSTNPGEALVKGGDSPVTPVTTISLTFNNLDWSTPQTVTIVGQDEAVDDGNQLITFTTAVDTGATADADYDVLNPADVTATINDDDNAGITVNPTSGLVTTESGGTDTFTVVLDTQPTANVTVDVTSPDITEVKVQGGSSPATPVTTITLTFTNLDWSTPQTVTAVGQDDGATDGNIAVTLTTAAAVSGDGNYSGLDPANVSVTNNDDDAAGVTVNPTSGLSTTEAGGTDTFTVVLATPPTANVTIGVTSGTPAEILVQGGDSPATPVTMITLTFTMGDWSTPQTVTLVGKDDAGAMDGDQAVTITNANTVSGDGFYNGLIVANVSATNVDDDLPVAPNPPVVTTPAATPFFTSSTPATISGTKDANSSIWFNGGEVVAIDAMTTWSVSQALVLGANAFAITSKEITLLESAPAVNIDITLDQANPNPPVISELDDGAVSSPITTGNNDLKIEGGPANGGAGTDCEPSATVQAFESAVLRASTTCDGSGNYTLTVSKFANGTFTFDISQTDQAGNPSTSVQQIWTRSVTPPGPPTITLPVASPHFTNTAPITLSGGCDSTSAHTVKLAGAQAGTAACGAAGGFAPNEYSFSLTDPGSDGTFTYLVSQIEDLTNAESTAVSLDWVFDTVAPAIVVLTLPVANPVTTSSNSIIIAGSCEIGATVDLSGENSSMVSIDTQQDLSCTGTFAFTTAAQVVDDTFTFTITQTDRAGNASGAVTVTMIRDSNVPVTPALVQPAASTVYLNSIMPADTLTIEVSCTNDGNHTVTLDDGVSVPPLEEACAAATHTFVVANPGAESTSNFTIFQTNNLLVPPVDSASIAVTWIIDTTAPADPVIVAPSVDPFTSPDPLVVTGNCEAGATVNIDPFVPSTFTANQVCAADGTYTFTVTEGAPADDTKDNTYTYDVYQTDLATNVSAGQGVADITWIRDTFAITPPVITSPAANPFTSNTADLVLLGTCTAGNDVNLSGADTQTTPCVAGGFSFLVTGLADATHVFNLTQTFSATTSSPISFTWVKDTSLPDLTIVFAPVEPDNPTKDVVFEFTSTDPLATFECKLDAGAFAACVSPIVFTGLTGAHIAEVRARDTAGNISPPDPDQPFSWTQAFNDTVVLYHMDVGAPLADASLYGAPNESTLTDGGTALATGKFAEGRDFVKAEGDFMSAADNDAHRAFRTQMTVEAWVSFDAPGLANKGKAVIVSKYDSATAEEWKFGIFRRGGGGGEGNLLLFFQAGVDGLAPGREAVSGKIFTGVTIYPTPFHHVAVTFNRGTVSFFFDGALLSTRVLGVAGTSLINKDTATPPDLVLGAEEAGTANFINGIVDELRISQTVRYLSTFSVPGGAFTAD